MGSGGKPKRLSVCLRGGGSVLDGRPLSRTEGRKQVPGASVSPQSPRPACAHGRYSINNWWVRDQMSRSALLPGQLLTYGSEGHLSTFSSHPSPGFLLPPPTSIPLFPREQHMLSFAFSLLVFWPAQGEQRNWKELGKVSSSPHTGYQADGLGCFSGRNTKFIPFPVTLAIVRDELISYKAW